MGLKEFFIRQNHISQMIFILILLYAVSSINVLLLALGILPHIPGMYLNPYIMVAFSLISFALTAFISAYHLSTMIRRRKRKTDQEEPVL